MLFDLRARGRRRTVRIVYTGLAGLMAIGLVGFGIGGGFGSGGIFNAASNSEGGSHTSYAKEVQRYERLATQQPRNAAAWEGLVKALLHEAGGSQYVSEAGVVTSKGKELLKRASRAWESYLGLNPPKPNTELALLMTTHVYDEQVLNEPAQAVQALQIVLPTRPKSAALWAALAEDAYRAKNVRLGDLASQKAVALAPAAQQPRLTTELAEAKKNGAAGGKTYTTTTNGKTYVVKAAGGGSFTGTEVKTTPPPAGTTSTKK